MKLKEELKLVRITSGEEIIGNITENQNSYTIRDGYVLIPGGEGNIAYMPFMPYTKASKGVVIDKSFVLFCVEPVDELAARIKEQISGVIVPKKQGIIT